MPPVVFVLGFPWPGVWPLTLGAFWPLGWNELLIASFSHRSIDVRDGILLATGLHVHRNSAHSAGVGAIFDRVLTELVSKMRDMRMDKTELGCLRAIILFNPGEGGRGGRPPGPAQR